MTYTTDPDINNKRLRCHTNEAENFTAYTQIPCDRKLIRAKKKFKIIPLFFVIFFLLCSFLIVKKTKIKPISNRICTLIREYRVK